MNAVLERHTREVAELGDINEQAMAEIIKSLRVLMNTDVSYHSEPFVK